MSEIADRVKEQLGQINTSVDQFVNASRGLYVKIKDESNKQFDELVKAGEAQKEVESNFLKQLGNDFLSPFQDPKESFTQMKNASVGFYVKAKDQSEKYFDELVELGSTKLTKAEKAAD